MRVFTFLFLCAINAFSEISGRTYFQEIRMPNVTATQDDAYLCHSQTVENHEQFLTHFKPLDTEVTHHMLLFLCEEPGSKKRVWNCGEGPGRKPVCKGKQKILFSWAMKAKEFELPPDTSFPISQDELPTLVLQVHYKDASGFENLPDGKDNSGWRLTMSDEPTKKLAGIYLFVADGVVAPLGATTLGVSCPYNGKAVLHPFAFRVHAHNHGILNYAFASSSNGLKLIGAKSPQEDQTYYMIANKSLKIKPGDQLTAKCIMFNEEDRRIYMGNTRKDEMCNFYMMYWVRRREAKVIFDRTTEGCYPTIPFALDNDFLKFNKGPWKKRWNFRRDDDDDDDDEEEEDDK